MTRIILKDPIPQAYECAQLPLSEQLKTRRISKISLSQSLGLIIPKLGGFTICIGRHNSFYDAAFTFGHELGHTYWYDIETGDSPRHQFRGGPFTISSWQLKAEESWCDTFADYWYLYLNLGNRSSLSKLLKGIGVYGTKQREVGS